LEMAEGVLKSKINAVDKSRNARLKSEENEESESPLTDTEVPLTWDNKGRLSINDKQFNKLGDSGTEIKFLKNDNSIVNGKINPNQPEDIDEEIGLINIFTSSGTTVAIDGSKIRELGGIETPKGILNRGHYDARKKREVEQSDWKQSVEELGWLLGKDIEYKKDNETKSATVLNKEEQLKDKGIPGGLKVKSPDSEGKKGNVYFLKDIKSKIITQNGKNVDTKNLLHNRDYVQSMLNSLFSDDKEYERELIINERDKKDLLNDIKHKAKNNETLINPIQVMQIFNKAHYKYTVEEYESIPDGKQGSSLQGKGKGVNKKKNYKKMPDSSGRHVALFKQWNEGVLDLLQDYGEYIPDALKKFIISVLNDNTLFGKGGAQAKLLHDYFNIKVSKEEVFSDGYDNDGDGKKKSTKTDIYIETKDTSGVFKQPKSSSLQLKKENFKDVPFIIEGNQKGESATSYVCYYLGTAPNGLIIFKFKTNNIDYLQNYKRSEQDLTEPEDMKGNIGDEVMYGAIPLPKGSNKDLRINSEVPMYFTDMSLQEEVKGPGTFGIDNLYYLQGESDGGVMRLNTKNPDSSHGDEQHDFRLVQKKFENIKN